MVKFAKYQHIIAGIVRARPNRSSHRPTAAAAAKTALADPTERATLEAAFKAQKKYTSLFGYTVAQKYVNPFSA